MDKRLVALIQSGRRRRADQLRQAWDRGDAVLPIPAGWSPDATEQLLGLVRPHTVIAEDGRASTLDDPLPVNDDVALVVATSGSTGDPKAVELDRAALDHTVHASIARLGCTAEDRWLACLPLHHVAGVLVLLRAWKLGRQPIVLDRFDPADVAAAEADCVSLVPTMLARLLSADVDVSGLHVLLGGAAADTRLLSAARSAGATVTVSYGMTETCGGCVYDGRPLDGVEIHLADDGHVEVAGPTLMRGYRNRPELTAASLRGGWLRTGDLGTWGDDGRLRILGRADDVIITGGENVTPGEVEALLGRHPGLAAVAVFGETDAEWGQRVVAVGVPADRDRPPTLDDLRDWVTARGPAHLAPRRLRLVDELPRTDLGKIDRAALASTDR